MASHSDDESTCPDERSLREELARIAQRTYRAGLVAASDGNVSGRLPNGNLLISPSGLSLGDLTPKDMIEVDRHGRPISLLAPGRRPTSEMLMHLAIYDERADVGAVLHAHPPITIAFSIAGESLATCVIPEVVVGLGTIPTIDYTTPTTRETAEAVRQHIRRRDALILEHHGTVTVAASITRAFYVLDKVEHSSKILLAAKQLGQIRPLPPQEVERLLAMREKLGLPPIVPTGPAPPRRTAGHSSAAAAPADTAARPAPNPR